MRAGRKSPLRLTVGGLGVALVLVAAGCGSTKTVTMTSPARAANSVSEGTPHVYEGTVSGTSHPVAKMDCSAFDQYAEAGAENRGTISDSLLVNTEGSDAGVGYATPSVEKSVAWGHPFSRLAQAVEVRPYAGHGAPSRHYKFTMYCVKDQSAAWVIFG